MLRYLLLFLCTNMRKFSERDVHVYYCAKSQLINIVKIHIILQKGGASMYDVLDVAAYVVNEYWVNGSPITNLKLQKILYYIQGYTLRRHGSPAFSEGIYKWPYGPVVPQVYFNYNYSRSKGIPELSDEHSRKLEKIFRRDSATTRIIDEVITKSFSFSAVQLVQMTHAESPWKAANDSELIPLGAIASYFGSNDPLNLERV